MILVTGAAGKTGRAVIRGVHARGAPVRALVRRDSYRSEAQEAGAREVFVGDLRDSETLKRAAEQIHAVYHIPPNMHPDEVGMGEAILQAAVEAGVEHFVYHSVLHPQVEAMPHHWRKLQVEAKILESGLPFTILQPAAYMQNTLGGLTDAVERGVFEVPYPVGTRLAMVDLADVGQVAADVLTEPGHHGAIYELVGEAAISVLQVTEVMAQVLGRSVAPQQIPLEEWAGRARDRGLDAGRIEDFLAMFRHYAQFHFIGNPKVLTTLLGRPPTRYPDFLRAETDTVQGVTSSEG